MKKILLSVLASTIAFFVASAQTNIANYTFAKSIGAYTPLSSPTVLGTATGSGSGNPSLDGMNYRVAFPGGFTFTFGGVAQTDININSNGYIGFATAIWTGNTTSPLANNPAGATTNGIISGFARDLNAVYNTTASVIGDISYELIGTAPDRELVVQFKNFKPYSGVVDARLLNFQIHLFESTHTTNPNQIQVVYGATNIGNATATDVKVGIRGNSTTWFDNVNSLMISDVPTGTTCDWTNAVTSISNTSNLLFTSANTNISIPNGLVFTWIPNATSLAPVRTFSAVTGITQNEATISWTAPIGAAQYNIQYRVPGTCAWTTFTGSPVSTNSVILSGLAPLTIYQVRVQSTNGTNTAIYSHIPNSTGVGSGYVTAGTFSTLATCPVPSSLNVSGISPTSANFTWTAGGTESAWDIYYGTLPLTPPTATTVPTATTATNSFSATSLTPSTTYSVYVRANCGAGDLSVWTPVTIFTTPCNPVVSLPWTEGFEGLASTGATILPSCWTYTNLAGTNSPGTFTVIDTYQEPRTGTTAMYNQWSTTAWVFTPGFQLTAGVSYDFSFYMMNKSGTLPFTLDVAYGNSASAAGMTNTLLVAYSATNTAYTQFKYTIVPSLTGTYYFGTKGTSINSTPWYLSFDDFSLELTPSCAQPTGITASAISTSSVNLSWTAPATGTPVNYNWEVRTTGAPGSGGAVASGSVAAPTTSANAMGLAANTTYTVYVRTDCGGGDYSTWNMGTFYTGYCTPAPTSVDDLGITNVNISSGQINNTTVAEPGNYGDYSAQVANVFQNTNVPFSITFQTDIYDYNTKIWIDFNDDLDFDDAGEEVYTGLSGSTSPNTLTGMITIPTAANVGAHRLRIGATDSGTPTPCYTGSYGTYEDYSVNVQVPPSCTLTPVAGVISGPTTVNVGTSNSYTISPSAANLQWYSATSSTGPWSPIAGATNSVQTIAAVGNGTVYYTVIASGLGCVNDTANVALSVNIVFPGDAVCNAISLPMGFSGPYSLFGATTQTGEVVPPGSGCETNNSWCDNTLNNSLWFSFVAPASGYVTVQSPDFDTQLAVWNAATCNGLLSSSTATLIAANDDDANYTANSGVQFSSFVHAACLTPGQTYYIQLDSYSAATASDETSIVITDMGAPLNTSFTGLAANYCLPTGSSTLTPSVTGGVFTINTSTTSVSSFSASAVGSYTVNYALYGCKSSSVTSVNPNPTLTVVASNTAICNGSSATFTASGANSYTWSPAGGTSAIAVVSPTTTSNYTVVGQSALGCSSTATVDLIVNSAPTLSISATSTVICSGVSSTLTANSSSPNYSWSPSGNTTAVEIVSSANVYTVTSQNLGCTSTETISIGVNTTPTVVATVSTPSLCSGSSATLTASGATNYTWTPTGDLTATSIVNPSASTVYSVTGSTAGCSATATVSLLVTATPTISASASSTVICSGGAASSTLTATSTTPDYSWAPTGGTSSTEVVTPGSNTIYTVTSTNAGCSGTATVGINVSTTPTVNATATATNICSGITVTLTASGTATNYTWTPTGDLTPISVVNPSVTASYVVTGESSGCSATATVNVNVTSTPTVSVVASSTSICSGSSATLTAVSSTPNYTWAPAGGTADIAIVSPNSNTTYTVTSTNGACVGTATISIGVLSVPVLTVSPSNITACSGSTVALTASGADTYTWSSGGGNAATAVFTPTAMASYSVNGSNMCGSGTATASVNVVSPLTLSASTSATIICSGVESATLTVTGTATNFTWSPGGQTTSNVVVSPTITTIYTVTTSNACGVVTSTVTQNVENCTGIEELFAAGMNVYPNPTTDIVNFSIPAELVGQVKLEMYDAIGKLVALEELTKEVTSLKVNKFEDGVYFFKLISNNGDVKIGKLIKQ